MARTRPERGRLPSGYFGDSDAVGGEISGVVQMAIGSLRGDLGRAAGCSPLERYRFVGDGAVGAEVVGHDRDVAVGDVAQDRS